MKYIHTSILMALVYGLMIGLLGACSTTQTKRCNNYNQYGQRWSGLCPGGLNPQ